MDNRITVAYYRSSSELQENSIDMQKYKAEKKAIQLNLLIENVYIDEFVSARTNKIFQRPQMKNLYDDIKNGIVGKLLVYKRDRIARQSVEYLQFYEHCKKYKVEVIFTSDMEKELTFDYMGEFFEHIMAGFVELEATNIHERLNQSRITRFYNNEYGRKMPFGYSWNPTTRIIELNAADLSLVREIFYEAKSGKYSTLNDLRKHLNSSNKLKKGKPWSVQALEKLLRHPLYCGNYIMHFSGKEHSKFHEELAIISLEAWEDVQEMVEDMMQRRDSKKAEDPYLLHNLLSCSICQKPLTSKVIADETGQENKIYGCAKHDISLIKENVEDFVIKHILSYVVSLASTNWSKLFNKQNKNEVKSKKVTAKNEQQELKRLRSNIFRQADILLGNPETSIKNEVELNLLALHGDLASQREKYDDSLRSLNTALNFSEQVKEDLAQLKNEEIINYLQKYSKTHLRALIENVLTIVKVNPNREFDFVYKYPYSLKGDSV
ncbi:recombinase family protein [Paenibacillus oryzisoli]|uniref:Recombinase family protein n=1 Tax=Paenibacillus oryzisoli TaxID=1850517 RepID=A0A198AJG1_9BACL|nr:recombinase family protein [Paenibacillus oryzisoli]OAS21367.1 hypothetical protein A8708_31360 [Paenibacillus oryzisoli]